MRLVNSALAVTILGLAGLVTGLADDTKKDKKGDSPAIPKAGPALVTLKVAML